MSAKEHEAYSEDEFGATLQVPLEEFSDDTESRHTYKEPQLVAHVAAAAVDRTTGFRPQRRPPMPLLRIFDDTQQSGENRRIRQSPFVIGRAQGDVTIPLDLQMSSRHAAIAFHQGRGSGGWYLKDLDSSNGTFVRVSSALLKHGQIIVMGDGRYLFDMGQGATPASLNATTGLGGTMSWQADAANDGDAAHPSLVRIEEPGSDAERFVLSDHEGWIGRDADSCSIVLDDPTVSPRHARIFTDRRGRWCVENDDSLNGLWVRIDEIALGRGAYFQCGEQRFLFKLL